MASRIKQNTEKNLNHVFFNPLEDNLVEFSPEPKIPSSPKKFLNKRIQTNTDKHIYNVNIGALDGNQSNKLTSQFKQLQNNLTQSQVSDFNSTVSMNEDKTSKEYGYGDLKYETTNTNSKKILPGTDTFVFGLNDKKEKNTKNKNESNTSNKEVIMDESEINHILISEANEDNMLNNDGVEIQRVESK